MEHILNYNEFTDEPQQKLQETCYEVADELITSLSDYEVCVNGTKRDFHKVKQKIQEHLNERTDRVGSFNMYIDIMNIDIDSKIGNRTLWEWAKAMDKIDKDDKLEEFLLKYKKEFYNTYFKTISVGELKMLYEQEEIEKYLPLVWEMLEKSYEGIGGLKSYRDYNDFKKRKHLLMVVRDFNKDLLACAVFRRIASSLKMTAIGCNQKDDGRLALQQIIQHTISELELHYWTEVSGIIEYYFKKHNAFPMPNTIASKILQVDEDQIILSKKDNIHYDRFFGQDRDRFTKMIYGIKSEEIFQEAMSEFEDYYDFMKEVNKMVNESKETKYSVRQAIYIIENLYRMHEEDGLNELIPKWHDALRDSVEVLNSTKEKTQTISDYIEYGNFLLSDTQILTLNVIK